MNVQRSSESSETFHSHHVFDTGTDSWTGIHFGESASTQSGSNFSLDLNREPYDAEPRPSAYEEDGWRAEKRQRAAGEHDITTPPDTTTAETTPRDSPESDGTPPTKCRRTAKKKKTWLCIFRGCTEVPKTKYNCYSHVWDVHLRNTVRGDAHGVAYKNLSDKNQAKLMCSRYMMKADEAQKSIHPNSMVSCCINPEEEKFDVGFFNGSLISQNQPQHPPQQSPANENDLWNFLIQTQQLSSTNCIFFFPTIIISIIT